MRREPIAVFLLVLSVPGCYSVGREADTDETADGGESLTPDEVGVFLDSSRGADRADQAEAAVGALVASSVGGGRTDHPVPKFPKLRIGMTFSEVKALIDAEPRRCEDERETKALYGIFFDRLCRSSTCQIVTYELYLGNREQGDQSPRPASTHSLVFDNFGVLQDWSETFR